MRTPVGFDLSRPTRLPCGPSCPRGRFYFRGAKLNNKKRVMAFVDGFNLYHAIDNLDIDPKTKRLLRQKQHLKWLDIRSLASAFVPPSREEVIAVHYFSTFATWPERVLSHLP